MKTIINIAVAEDQVLFRECFVANIRRFEHLNIIAEAGNGRQLLDMIASTPVKPDIVLTDLSMPEMNGIELTRQLRCDYPDVKIIVLSVLGDEKYVSSMAQLGVNGYLAKNAELDEVRRAVESVHERGFFFNDTMRKGLKMEDATSRTRRNQLHVVDSLTRREREVLDLICHEYTTPEIAEKLFLSVRTIEGHRNNLLEKTGARNTAGLVIFALRNDLVSVGI